MRAAPPIRTPRRRLAAHHRHLRRRQAFEFAAVLIGAAAVFGPAIAALFL